MKRRTLLTLGMVVLLAIPGWCQDQSSVRQLIKRYYAAIEARDYQTAYQFWKGNGPGSPASLSAFTKGFQQTRHTSVVVLKAGRPEGAAGSVYVTVPVEVRAELKNGKRQTFAGTYTLRRSNIPTPAQNAWHLYSARLKPVL